MTTEAEKISVLFVCMGNICRSPTAEGVFRHYVAEAGLDEHVEIEEDRLKSTVDEVLERFEESR